MFKDWLKLGISLKDNGYSVDEFICPECNKKRIDYVFVGDSETKKGYMCLWCNHCKKGIRMSRVVIPENAKSFDFSDDIANLIPNFMEIYPEE